MNQRITDADLDVILGSVLGLTLKGQLAADLRDCRASLAERDAEIRRLKEQLTESGGK